MRKFRLTLRRRRDEPPPLASTVCDDPTLLAFTDCDEQHLSLSITALLKTPQYTPFTTVVEIVEIEDQPMPGVVKFSLPG